MERFREPKEKEASKTEIRKGKKVELRRIVILYSHSNYYLHVWCFTPSNLKEYSYKKLTLQLGLCAIGINYFNYYWHRLKQFKFPNGRIELLDKH